MRLKESDIRREYNPVAVGYCDAHYIAQGLFKIGYTAGVYGWNADVYADPTQCYCVAIVTGYRPIGVSNEQTREIVKRYNEIAREQIESGKAARGDFGLAYLAHNMLRELAGVIRKC